MRQDVWSKKTWEADPKDVEARIEASEAAKPISITQEQAEAINEQSKSNITVLSKEQAEALNEQNKPVKFTEAEAKEREVKALGKDNNVNNKSVDNSDKKNIIELKINMFDKSDPIYLDALSIEEEPGFEDIHLHGSPSSVEVIRNGEKVYLGVDDFIADINNKGYKGGDIRLCSCSTGQGDNSFAQQLSKKLGIKVKAPDDVLYYIPEDGVLFVGSEFRDTGRWRIFDKGVEIID